MSTNPTSKSKVAVVVAAYNEEKYIGRCLRSLLSQSMQQNRYEIIVVDDCSSDKTNYAISILKNPNDHLIKLINNEKNIGLPMSLNKAIESTTCAYIVRVDADDYVSKFFLDFLAYYLDCYSDADAVACNYNTVTENDAVTAHFNAQDNPIACGIMFRRCAMLNCGLYDPNMLMHEEREFIHRFKKTYQLHYLPVPLYRYRRHSDNMTSDQAKSIVFEKMLTEKIHEAKD